jgi:hypothetical protein
MCSVMQNSLDGDLVTHLIIVGARKLARVSLLDMDDTNDVHYCCANLQCKIKCNKNNKIA